MRRFRVGQIAAYRLAVHDEPKVATHLALGLQVGLDEALRLIAKVGARRVVLDSLAELRRAGFRVRYRRLGYGPRMAPHVIGVAEVP